MLKQAKIAQRKGVVTFLFLFMGVAVWAQQPKERPRPADASAMAAQQTERMKKELQLTDEQVTKVDEVNAKYAKQQQALFETKEKDQTASRAQMEKLEKEKEAELKPLLTEAQWQTHQENKKGHKHDGSPKKGKKPKETAN